MGDTWRGRKRDEHRRHGRHPRSGWAVQGPQAPALGRDMEDRVELVLRSMLAGGLIQGFVRLHPSITDKEVADRVLSVFQPDAPHSHQQQ